MKLIGIGAFTKAYLLDNGRVQLNSCCPIKEVMACGWFPESYLFPKLELVDTETYIMEFLPRVKAPKKQLNERAYKLYKLLQTTVGYDYFTLYNWFEINLSGWDEQEVILEALDACSNFGTEIGFEISPRNISTDENGNLIMADCFYHKPTLRGLVK